MIRISDQIEIPEEEVRFTASRSSGPGGQNVNKVSSRMTLLFDVLNSESLSGEQKEQVLDRLSNRINKRGVLRVVSQRFRTQAANRRAALERFVLLLEQALRKERPRKRTSISRSTRERRREDKARRSRLKQSRSQTSREEME